MEENSYQSPNREEQNRHPSTQYPHTVVPRRQSQRQLWPMRVAAFWFLAFCVPTIMMVILGLLVLTFD